MISWPIQLNGNIGFWILFLIFIVYRLFVANYFPAARNIFFPAFGKLDQRYAFKSYGKNLVNHFSANIYRRLIKDI